MHEIILHHYPPSPVSEKVRIALGIKQLSWRSVEIPRLPPKPLLMPLTGGYRRTPVMQIGADIYCDTACILAELERRFPQPSLLPGGPGLDWGVVRWIDTGILDAAIRIVLGHDPSGLPEAFAKDRGRLYLGPQYDLDAVHRDLPQTISQLGAQMAWLDSALSDERPFFAGNSAGLVDAVAYYIVWFLRGRWPQGPAFLAGFQALEAWEKRVEAIGHGQSSPLSGEEALLIATDPEPETPAMVRDDDPQGLSAGMAVRIVPDSDGGDPEVAGNLHVADRERLAVFRDHGQLGHVCVHFPRIGYRVLVD